MDEKRQCLLKDKSDDVHAKKIFVTETALVQPGEEECTLTLENFCECLNHQLQISLPQYIIKMAI